MSCSCYVNAHTEGVVTEGGLIVGSGSQVVGVESVSWPRTVAGHRSPHCLYTSNVALIYWSADKPRHRG